MVKIMKYTVPGTNSHARNKLNSFKCIAVKIIIVNKQSANGELSGKVSTG